MDENQVTTAPLFGVLPRSALRWIGLGLVLAILVCGMVVIVLWLQGFGTGSALDVQVAQETVKKEFGQHRLEKLERRQLMRCGLQEIDQQARRIWNNIEIYETEAVQWKAAFAELMVSEQGKRVGDDPWAVRYFWDQWGNRLPNASEAQDHRNNLNTLMLSVHEALKKEGTAYQPSPELLDRIALIETQVDEGRASYSRHRRLLDALIGMVEEEKPVDQKTLKDRVEDLDKQMVLEDFAHPSSSGNLPASDARPAVPSGQDQTKSSAAADDDSLDALYDQATRKSDATGDFGRTTLIRDSVKGADTRKP